MRHRKSALLAAIVAAGLMAPRASAQQFGVAGFGGNAFGGVGGFNNGLGGFNTGFGGYNGVGYGSLGYNNFGSYGYNNFYNYRPVPQTYNNMGGLIGTIRTQTGGGNSYRYGYGPAVGGRRR